MALFHLSKALLGLSLLLFFTSTYAKSNNALLKKADNEFRGEISLKSGEKVHITLAFNGADQQKGLSGIRSKDFNDNQGMLFFFLEEKPRQFWMLNTYFNIDVFFLNKDLKVIAVQRDLKFYPSKRVTKNIAITHNISSRHVLEMKSSSKIAKKIKMGDQLIWTGRPSLLQIESSIRRQK